MAMVVRAKVIECRASTRAQAVRLWNETLGDTTKNVTIEADRIVIETHDQNRQQQKSQKRVI